MTPIGPRDEPRVLKPGDLYLVTGDLVKQVSIYETLPVPADVRELFDKGRMKLVCQHPCEALEFLVMPEAAR